VKYRTPTWTGDLPLSGWLARYGAAVVYTQGYLDLDIYSKSDKSSGQVKSMNISESCRLKILCPTPIAQRSWALKLGEMPGSCP